MSKEIDKTVKETDKIVKETDKIVKELTDISRHNGYSDEAEHIPWYGWLVIVLFAIGGLIMIWAMIIACNTHSVEEKIVKQFYNQQEIIETYDEVHILKIERKNTTLMECDDLPPKHHYAFHIITVVGIIGETSVEHKYVATTHYHIVWRGFYNDEIIDDCDIIKLEVS